MVDLLDEEISPTEVRIAIRALKNGKAPGWDGLPTEFYKCSEAMFSPALARLFNFLYENSLYPKAWSLSIIQPIFKKKGALNEPDNWRGVALLPSISKIYTKVLCSRLKKWITENDKICENQAGFRTGYSTVDNSFVLRTLIDSALARKGRRLYCCFVDLRKAFDSVSRMALWYKLWEIGVSGKLIKTLRQIYSQSRFAIKISQTSRSKDVASRTGVLQGCHFSPLLFIIFINDLIKFLPTDSGTPVVGDQYIQALLFADDLVLCSHTVDGLQQLLDKLKIYCDYWNLEVNKEKTKVMVFKKGTRLAKKEHWNYGRYNLETVREFKYFGIIFSCNGLWKKHMKEGTKKARVSSLQILKMCSRCPYLPLSLLLRIYDATVKSALLYGAEIWGPEADATVEAPGTYFYKKVLRLPMSASNVGVHLLLDRSGISISHKAEAILKALLYWHRIQKMEDFRLPKKCYLHQLEEMRKGKACWAECIKTLFINIGLQAFWYSAPQNVRSFRKRCTEELEKMERSRLRNLAVQYESLNKLRTVLDLTGRDAPIVSQEIRANPEKHRWILMTLLSCPGNLVIRHMGMTLCILCNEPTRDIFTHLLAFCIKTQNYLWREQNMLNMIRSIKSDPGSAPVTLIYWLFMSESRFRLQQDYAMLFSSIRSFPILADT